MDPNTPAAIEISNSSQIDSSESRLLQEAQRQARERTATMQGAEQAGRQRREAERAAANQRAFEKCLAGYTPPTSEQLDREQRLKEKSERERMADAIAYSGVTDLHAAAMGHIDAPREWQAAFNNVLERIKRGHTVALIGDRGLGKTMIGCKIAVDFVQAGRRVRYMKLTSIIRRITSTWRSWKMTSEEAFEQLRQVPCLIIDEVQEGMANEIGRSLLVDLVDERYGKVGGTLLIANYTSDQLIESLGASIIRRMSERGVVIQANWCPFTDSETTRRVQAAIEGRLVQRDCWQLPGAETTN